MTKFSISGQLLEKILQMEGSFHIQMYFKLAFSSGK